MCANVIAVPQVIIQEIIDEINRYNAANLLPDWPARWQPRPEDMKSSFPGALLGVIAPDTEARLSVQTMQWGYDVSWSKQLIFNTRFDTATKPGRNMWADSLAERRCVVPTFGFYEPHKSQTFINPRSGKPNKQNYFFTGPDSEIVFLAGVFQDMQFSLMTTEPNSIMSPIHGRMPVVLMPNELDSWLFGDYLSVEDRSSIDLISNKVERFQEDSGGVLEGSWKDPEKLEGSWERSTKS